MPGQGDGYPQPRDEHYQDARCFQHGRLPSKTRPRAGGLPAYVMPIVFGGAPAVNVLFTMYLHPPKVTPNPMLWVGFALVAAGASMVLYFKPAA